MLGERDVVTAWETSVRQEGPTEKCGIAGQIAFRHSFSSQGDANTGRFAIRPQRSSTMVLPLGRVDRFPPGKTRQTDGQL